MVNYAPTQAHQLADFILFGFRNTSGICPGNVAGKHSHEYLVKTPYLP
jgi:hypothetical protein